MREIQLKEEIEKIFQFAYMWMGETGRLQELKHEFFKFHEQLYQPMRVAIVGKIKTGKSTLMNALLGEEMVATGNRELTFNINWLKYAEKPGLRVNFKDDSPSETYSLEELEALTGRNKEKQEYLLRIKFIEVFYPSDVLKLFHLIDTPGLESFFVDDSKNTLEFLGLHTAVNDDTQSAASGADAVLYLFNQSLAMTDHNLMEEFHGGLLQGTSPINAIGVLNKVDAYWPSVESPTLAGKKIANRLMEDHEDVKNVFYGIYPVCGLLAFGSKTLTEEEYMVLRELSKLPPDRFARLVKNSERFASREYQDVPVSPQLRQALLARLGQYGVSEAYRLIQSGIDTMEDLSEALLELSGFQELIKCIESHFGNRSFLIKLNTCFKRVRDACFKAFQKLPDSERKIIDEINGQFEAFESKQMAFQEFQILQSYYQGKVKFSNDEADQLLSVTGEYGTSCGERLGMDENTCVKTLIPMAMKFEQYWHQKSNDFLDTDRSTIFAASVLAHSYQKILYHLKAAEKHLYL